jgi:hypothetical protein
MTFNINCIPYSQNDRFPKLLPMLEVIYIYREIYIFALFVHIPFDMICRLRLNKERIMRSNPIYKNAD